MFSTSGKTLQLISVITAILGDPTSAPVIVVMPKTLLDNWRRELERWAPGTKPAIFHGPRKAHALADVTSGRLRLLLTTYSTMVNEIDALRAVRWEAAFFDEARGNSIPPCVVVVPVRRP